jgi:hypothetical protein
MKELFVPYPKCSVWVHITHLPQQCYNPKSVIFQEKLLKVLKCYNFLWVQWRHNCSSAASFANCGMTLYLFKVHLQTYLSIPITQKYQILSCDTFVTNERYDLQCQHISELTYQYNLCDSSFWVSYCQLYREHPKILLTSFCSLAHKYNSHSCYSHWASMAVECRVIWVLILILLVKFNFLIWVYSSSTVLCTVYCDILWLRKGADGGHLWMW